MFSDGYGTRAWKSFDWDAMNRLYEKGYIDDPKSKAKSVIVTEEGIKRAEELFRHFFLE
jgi:Mn-dependent DtxR family transcriptional regulator